MWGKSDCIILKSSYLVTSGDIIIKRPMQGAEVCYVEP